MELGQTQEMLKELWKAHNEAFAKIYKLLRNLLSSDPRSQWDQVCHEMHEHNLWDGVNGQMTTERHLRLWNAFQDCLELHKLTVFTADLAERQRFYIQQAVRNPQKATVHQHIS